jgi:hypothetical protein
VTLTCKSTLAGKALGKLAAAAAQTDHRHVSLGTVHRSPLPGKSTTVVRNPARAVVPFATMKRRLVTILKAGDAERTTAGGAFTEWQVALGLAGIVTILLAVVSSTMPKEGAPRGDDLVYEDIARHPFGVHTFPFGLRFGLPLIVHSLPLAHSTGFTVLALLCAGAAAAFGYLLIRELGGGRRLASIFAVLMCISPPFVVVVLRHGRNTDIATVFLMTAATYFAVRRNYWRLGLTLFVGVAVREAVLFVGPLAYALWATRPLDRAAAVRAVAVVAPAVAAYLAIRHSIRTVGESQVPGYGRSIAGGRLAVIELALRTPLQEARRMLSVYGPLWLAAPLALAGMAFARRGLVLVALCALAMTFALDWGRMILLAAPIFYPAGVYVLERWPILQRPAIAAFVLLVVVYALYMAHSGVRTGIIEAAAPPYPIR